MKILIAMDSFKGTMSSIEVSNLVKESALRHFPDARVISVPFADGGEGTLDVFVNALGAVEKETLISDPLGRKIKAKFGVINNKTAVIEMAQACGITLLKDSEKNPLKTTTYGTGELIREALDLGIRDIIIGIGGSATNDGGIGALMALGMKFFNKDGHEIGNGGEELGNISSISDETFDGRIYDSKITVICDVANPLTGENGATYVYGPQKGGDKERLEILEEGMCHYKELIKEYKNIDINSIAGSGAAGGLGGGLVAFMGAALKPGVDTMFQVVNFENLLSDTDFVITGEGKIDSQTANGKVPYGIAQKCILRGIPAFALVGAMDDGALSLLDNGITSIMPIYKRQMTFEEVKKDLYFHVTDAADRMIRFIKAGMQIRE